MGGTRRDSEQSERGARSMGVLFVLLGFDDLCADVAFRAPALGHAVRAFHICRGDPAVSPPFREGRLFLSDPYVSEVHARVCRRGTVDFLVNESARGTSVNGVEISGEQALEDGDWIEVGRTFLLYRAFHGATEGAPEEARFGPTRTLSPDLLRITMQLESVARTKQSVLLLGETGSGKGVAAEYIHELSGRSGPLVTVDCGALSATLFEPELFGVTKGAHSEAKQARPGLLRTAEKGTFFLDEIGNLPVELQAKLLRTLEEGKVRPVGSDRETAVDVRWMAGTNADVRSPSAAFRPDLFHRLGGFVVELPPLRKRREDLGILSSYLLAKAGVSQARMTKRAARALFFGQLSGNVRELKQALLRGVALAKGDKIDVEHLGLSDHAPAADAPLLPEREAALPGGDRAVRPSPVSRKALPPRTEIQGALDQSGGVQERAARILGTSERQLRRWMDELGIPRVRSRRET